MTALDALAGRLTTALEGLGGRQDEAQPAAPDVVALLERLGDLARRDPTTSATWLVHLALTGSYPTSGQVLALRRHLEVADGAVAPHLLGVALRGVAATGVTGVRLELVHDPVLVEVDFTARHDLNTGIQRVVRSAMPYWADRGVELVCWGRTGGLRRLTAWERRRVLDWHGPIGEDPGTVTAEHPVLVPVGGIVVLPEVPSGAASARLVALAEHSRTQIGAIGYDCIPVLHADLLPPAEPSRFVQYLSLLKHTRTVAAISSSAAIEFSGFARMLPAQGLAGPEVTVCSLPADAPPGDPAPAVDGVPHVLVVGSHEPRKNHLAVLDAAERLWRDGLAFSLEFVGGSSWASAGFERRVRALRRRGRDVLVHQVRDEALWAAYRRARFTVFVSLHEGYGLPVAESLAVGTPVLTTDYGSTAEIAADGGALTVDPRDDGAIYQAMDRLLTDDVLVATLSAQALARPARRWQDYADELWLALGRDSA